MNLHEVVKRRGLREFLDLTDRVYAGNARFVPPVRQQVRRWWRDGVRLFVLRNRRGHVVARTTMHTDDAFDAKLGRRCQLFGLTEFLPEAGPALLESVAAAGRAAGREVVFGPVSLLPNQAGGVITSGYEERGFIDSAYNPPYYQTTYERCGFTRRFESDTWICPIAPPDGWTDDEVPADVEIRRGDTSRLDEHLDLLRGMLNASFAPLSYYTEISAEQLHRQTEGLSYLLDESLLLFLTKAGQPVGFVLCIPDISEFIVRVGGNLGTLNQLRLLATRRRYRREAVLVIKGVVPQEQGRGYGRLLARALHRNLCAGGYTALRSTFVGRDNQASAAQYVAMGGRPLHGYTFYEKEL